jgi:hypothetical protein
MMREESRDFALIEFRQLQCELAHSNFIEEETVPSDAERVGTTWKRANKDGSQDRRFNGNYQIPILRYGALAFSSLTGLTEVYQVSSFDKATAFARAFGAHKQALAELDAQADLPALPASTSFSEEEERESAAREPMFAAEPRDNLALDWTLLIVLVASCAFAGLWVRHHGKDLIAALMPAPAASVAPSPSTVAASMAPAPRHPPHRGHQHSRDRRHQHHRAKPTRGSHHR